MKLDASGNPVYYLTDAMGSVIGLADGSGSTVSQFIYNGFGEVISGDDGSSLGGDFRFQGQWLESESGLYYMRARDYDAQTGLFLSRDAVDVQEQSVEAFNPYQFAFNNPLVYSDPTGLFTISEFNAAQSIQDTLMASAQRYVGAQAKDYVLQRLGDAFGNVVLSTLNAFLPGSTVLENVMNSVSDFENGLKGIVCPYFEGLPLKDNLFLDVKIHHGVPKDNGLNCSNYAQPPSKVTKKLKTQPGSDPDFLFRNSLPLFYRPKDSGAYLIGDVKAYLGAAREEIFENHNQWQNMVDYAKNYQLLPFVSYLALSDSNIFNPFETKGNPKGLSKSDRAKLAEIALSNGVILILANIIDKQINILT